VNAGALLQPSKGAACSSSCSRCSLFISTKTTLLLLLLLLGLHGSILQLWRHLCLHLLVPLPLPVLLLLL
jgi:hypothetical protein